MTLLRLRFPNTQSSHEINIINESFYGYNDQQLS